jgi:hypothetical protein
MRPRLIDRLYKPLLDPSRVPRVIREFEVERGFGRYTAACRSRFRRPRAVGRQTPLHARGFQHMRVLRPAQAHELLRRISAHDHTGVKKGSANLRGYPLDETARRELLDAVLTPDVDALLSGFFDSKYLVYWMSATVTPPDPEQQTVSFRWHCDKGPAEHLKMIVYLNGTPEHGGNTEFVDLADTERVARRGYVFGRTRSRTDDIERLSHVAGHPLSPCRQPLEAGDGVVFQPARVLHRGIVPTHAPRYALTLCLLPSPVPWREALNRGVMVDLSVDDKWPAHASELLTALESET